MLPKGMAGAEFHHKHRALYKSLPDHHDRLYEYIGSGGRLNRIVVVRTELFCRQSVMPLIDRWELLVEAGRWVKGGRGEIKGSSIGGKACH
jgi:hypothetical protein